ncbi:hypothetical protein GE061_013987 [Apolygus lucorum]|uniref:SH3 domain-containing protein n=1 Tax=Apolygus lucorum TaxID=248454 RepID=A0A8S9XS22_APOLU|nr:hypothetical protein GE061_013987 [Apolygus lucorum]
MSWLTAEILQNANEWLCADEKCSVPISLSSVHKQYVPDDPSKLSVKVGDKVEILRKPVDKSNKYYYVKSVTNKKKGLLSKDFMKEKQVFYVDRLLMKVNMSKKPKKLDINPSAPTTVYDGTTIIDSYDDTHHQYEPTQAQGPANDAGSPSIVQSTTPPSVIATDSVSVANSSDIDSNNASEGAEKSEDTNSDISKSSDVPVSESTTDAHKLNLDGKDIASTPASTISNAASQSHGIPNAADVVPATAEIPASSAQIDQSQIPETMNPVQEPNDEVENKMGVNDVPSNDTTEGETILENIASGWSSFLAFGKEGGETEAPKSDNQQNDNTESVTTESRTSEESSGQPMESDVEAETASIEASGRNEVTADQQVVSEQPVKLQDTVEQSVNDQNTPNNVSTDTSDPKHASSDLAVDQSNKEVSPDAKPSDMTDPNLKKDPSDPSVQFKTDPKRIVVSMNLVGEQTQNEPTDSVGSYNNSDAHSPAPHNEVTEGEINPVDLQVGHEQSTDRNSTMAASDELPKESLPKESTESTDTLENSQNREVTNEQLSAQQVESESEISDGEVVDEISADSEEDSSIQIPSSTTEDRAGNDSSMVSENKIEDSINSTDPVVTKESAPLASTFSSELNFVDPRQTDSAISSSSPVLEAPVANEVPKMEPEPLDIPPITIVEELVTDSPPVDEAITPASPPEPEIVDKGGEIIEEVFSEPPQVQEDPSDPWYSGIFSTFGSIQDMFSSQMAEKEVIPSTADTPEVTPKLQVSEDEKSETCSTETCESRPQIDLGAAKEENYLAFDQVWLSPRSMLLMIITASVVLLFSLGYYYLENLKRDVELVSKYNDLAGKLFIEQKEKEMLAEQLTSANESMTQISFDTTKYDEEINDLKALVQKYKEEKSTIEEKEKETRKKFMMVDKNYNELKNILSQNKQKGERSALILDIKNLKDSIAGNNIEIASLKEQLIEKKDEIKSLNARIMEFVETNKQLETNVEKAISENHETAQKFQDNIAKLEKTIEESTIARVKLEKECTQLKKERESLAVEKELAESSLQKYQRLKPSANSLAEWLDAKEVRVSLLAAEKKVEELTTIRDDFIREKTLLEDKQRTLIFDLEQLNEKYEKAEKDKIEALTKLQVLSDYFKEKESQLQEELGSKESLWLQKQSDDRTIYEQMRALREENTSFKNQNETLKREILDQEASFKKLITSAEEKAHENWVALRHHERRLKEAQMEASQLRSRLTALEATGDNSDDKINKGEVNGDIPPYGSATSPPFMLYPEFVPPPPLLPNTPSRPPPLGRISSPPLGDFTPPPPLVPYEMFLPPSPPPPAAHVLHKPQPLDGSHRIQKNSQSSNHSSESVQDRPRRNKR